MRVATIFHIFFITLAVQAGYCRPAWTIETTEPSLASSPTAVWSLIPGDYFEDGFLKSLRETRSPDKSIIEAGKNGGADSINITNTEDGLEFNADWGWHEGTLLFTLHRDGSMGEAYWGKDSKLEADGPRHFRLRGPEENAPMLGYTFVGKADHAVAEIALAGRYTDDKGHKCNFRSDGTLRCLGWDSTFELDNDHTFSHFDYFYVGIDHSRTIAFRHEGTILILYPVQPLPPDNDCAGEPDFEHPLAKLYPRTDRKK